VALGDVAVYDGGDADLLSQLGERGDGPELRHGDRFGLGRVLDRLIGAADVLGRAEILLPDNLGHASDAGALPQVPIRVAVDDLFHHASHSVLGHTPWHGICQEQS
jgi:hypothetical protein